MDKQLLKGARKAGILYLYLHIKLSITNYWKVREELGFRMHLYLSIYQFIKLSIISYWKVRDELGWSINYLFSTACTQFQFDDWVHGVLKINSFCIFGIKNHLVKLPSEWTSGVILWVQLESFPQGNKFHCLGYFPKWSENKPIPGVWAPAGWERELVIWHEPVINAAC